MSRRLTRPMLSSIFFVGPVAALKDPSAAGERAQLVTTPLIDALQRAGVPMSASPETLVRVNAGVQLAAATALTTGRYPRTAASVLAVSLVPTTIAGHPFWRETDPAARRAQQLQLAKNVSILGGLLIAALDTEGKPGKAWLARAAARRLARRAEHLATTAKLEGKIAQLEAAGAGDVLAETLTTAASGLATRAHAVADHVNRDTAERALDKAEEVARAAVSHAAGAVSEATATATGQVAESSERVADHAQEWRTTTRKQAKKATKAAKKTAKKTAKKAPRATRRARARAAKRLDSWGATAQHAAGGVQTRVQDLRG